MEPLKNLADGREREAGAVVAAARQALEDAEKQLAQLQSYRADYANRLNAGPVGDGVRLQNYHAFLGRLATAIDQQLKVVDGARQHLERVTEVWRGLHVDAASIGRAMEKIALGERRLVDKRLQGEEDERSMQRAVRERESG